MTSRSSEIRGLILHDLYHLPNASKFRIFFFIYNPFTVQIILSSIYLLFLKSDQYICTYLLGSSKKRMFANHSKLKVSSTRNTNSTLYIESTSNYRDTYVQFVSCIPKLCQQIRSIQFYLRRKQKCPKMQWNYYHHTMWYYYLHSDSFLKNGLTRQILIITLSASRAGHARQKFQK